MDDQMTIDRIVRDPAILVGKPVVKGTRIAVEVMLDYLAPQPQLRGPLRGLPSAHNGRRQSLPTF
jgi:hypothetical protein